MNLAHDKIRHLIDKLPPFESMQNTTQCDWWFKQFEKITELLCSSSSAESSDTIGTVPAHSNVSEPSQNQSSSSLSKDATVATDAASPAKLSWLPMSESVPPVAGWYPVRNRNEKYAAESRWVSNDSHWRNDAGDVFAEMEYLPIHLIGEK